MKRVAILLLVLLLVPSASATTVFLTSDHVGSESNDRAMLEEVANFIEELSGGRIDAVVDSNAPGPGEGTRAVESSSDVSVNFAAACAGNLDILARYSSANDKQIIFVNTGDYDLDNESYLRRAWDDNYSSTSFAGLNSPGEFLRRSGVDYIQPVKEYPDKASGGTYTSSDSSVNKFIAEEIIKSVDNPNTNNEYDDSLILRHGLNPSTMAEASTQLIANNDTAFNGTYNGYTASQLLYLTSSYLNGNGLSDVGDYGSPDSPEEYSQFAKNSYTIYDYMKMAGIVKSYMDENNKAPDSIDYDGASIGYYDLVYNFAKITANHTSSDTMGFDYDYSFTKVHESLLVNLMPVIIVSVVLLGLYGVFRRLRRRRRY